MRRPLLVVNRFVSVLFLSLLVACGSSLPDEDPLDRARQLHSAGQPEQAVSALHEAIRSRPEDPEARLLLAEVYLDLEQGDVAQASLSQAVERGLEPRRALLPGASALFIRERYSELIDLKIPFELSNSERAQVSFLQAEAKAALSPQADGTDDSVAISYIELFKMVEENSGNLEVAGIGNLLGQSRKERAVVERAWQHHVCAKHSAEPVGWQPLERTGSRILRVTAGQRSSPRRAGGIARNGNAGLVA